MRLFTINTGWLRAEPGKPAFLDAWGSMLNALVGRWGMDNWEWSSGYSGTWRMVKGNVSFTESIPITGDITFKLPLACSKPGALFILDNTTETVSGKVILEGMDAVTLHLTNPSTVFGNYGTERNQ